MSHFKILVASNYPEDALAPYNEQDENYFEDFHRLDEDKKDYVKYRKDYPGDTLAKFIAHWHSLDEDCIVNENEVSKIKRFNAEKRPYVVVDDSGEVVDSVAFYNETARYDYYGEIDEQGDDSWLAMLKDKNGNKTSIVEDIRDLDIDGSFADIEKECRKEYNDYITAFGGVPSVEKKWSEYAKDINEKFDEYVKDRNDDGYEEDDGERKIRNAYHYGLSDMARKEYWNQPAMVKANELGLGCPEDFACSEDEYVKKYANLPITAIVTDGAWIEQGKVGWFGMWGSEPMEESKWGELQRKTLKELKDKAIAGDYELMVQVYDCHI